MTATVLRYVLDYWQVGLIAVGIAAAAGYVHERDQRIQAEAVLKERLTEFRALKSRADSLNVARQQSDSVAQVALSANDSLRQELAQVDSVLEAQVDSASIRLTAAGDSLAATLDSLAVVVRDTVRPLVHTAQRQHARERGAQGELASRLASQLANRAKLLAVADSTAQVWQSRHESLETAYVARGRALEAAEKALADVQVDDGASWGERLLWGAGGLVVGFVGAKVN